PGVGSSGELELTVVSDARLALSHTCRAQPLPLTSWGGSLNGLRLRKMRLGQDILVNVIRVCSPSRRGFVQSPPHPIHSAAAASTGEH
ncbi:hypothetical protein GGI08_009224, partial [Coemansia sp. S2]